MEGNTAFLAKPLHLTGRLVFWCMLHVTHSNHCLKVMKSSSEFPDRRILAEAKSCKLVSLETTFLVVQFNTSPFWVSPYHSKNDRITQRQSILFQKGTTHVHACGHTRSLSPSPPVTWKLCGRTTFLSQHVPMQPWWMW